MEIVTALPALIGRGDEYRAGIPSAEAVGTFPAWEWSTPQYRDEEEEDRVSIKTGGEGDRESARRYNKDARDFVESEDYRKEVKRPDPAKDSLDEALKDAEAEALRRAKETDPQVTRDYEKPTRADD
jgi:hypothetical protein